MLGGVVVDDAKVLGRRLQEWEDFYNFDRPHGALGGQIPCERLRQKADGTSVTGLCQSHTSAARRPVMIPVPAPLLTPGSAWTDDAGT